MAKRPGKRFCLAKTVSYPLKTSMRRIGLATIYRNGLCYGEHMALTFKDVCGAGWAPGSDDDFNVYREAWRGSVSPVQSLRKACDGSGWARRGQP